MTDTELVAQVAMLAGRERGTTAVLVAHLAEMDRRALHLAAGFRSLSEYCCEVLHMSDHEAYNRVDAARLALRLPRILDLLADGSINLTTARLLGPHLTAENHEAVLAEARHKRKPQVEEIVARLAPRRDVEPSVRLLTVPATSSVPAPASAEGVGVASALTSPAARPTPLPVVAPLSPDRYEIRFTASTETRDKLRQAQDLLAHAVPKGDLAQVFDRALSALLADLLRKKCGVTQRPRRCGRARPDSRPTPAEVRRTVWTRDGGRCRFVGEGGRRCTATAKLEFHHVKAWITGGPATVQNIELRCRAHNALEADRLVGASRAGRAALAAPDLARGSGAARLP